MWPWDVSVAASDSPNLYGHFPCAAMGLDPQTSTSVLTLWEPVNNIIISILQMGVLR